MDTKPRQLSSGQSSTQFGAIFWRSGRKISLECHQAGGSYAWTPLVIHRYQPPHVSHQRCSHVHLHEAVAVWCLGSKDVFQGCKHLTPANCLHATVSNKGCAPRISVYSSLAACHHLHSDTCPRACNHQSLVHQIQYLAGYGHMQMQVPPAVGPCWTAGSSGKHGSL